MASISCVRPIMRWHGGKWRLAPWVIENMPSHRVYVEPFAGAASVLLRKHRSYAEVLNDLDCEVVNLFRVARDHGKDLARAVRLTPFSRVEFEAAYAPSEEPVEQARRTLVRSWMGFGSNAHNQATGFRGNATRSGTIPASDWGNFPDALIAVIERLSGVVIENRPAIDVIETYDSEGALFYVDPPYVHSTRGKNAYRYEMSDEDHAQLIARLRSLKGMVMLSGYENPIYEDSLADWKKLTTETMADGARERKECLWLSPNCREHGLFPCAQNPQPQETEQ